MTVYPCVSCGAEIQPGQPNLPSDVARGLRHMRCAEPCCRAHSPSGCCDPTDCGPCCPRCPTCPTLARRRAAGQPPPPRAGQPPRVRGFRGPEAVALAGISYRQLDYWCRTGLVEPSVRPAAGSGTQRLYSRHDVVRLATVNRLLQAGMSLAMIRSSLDPLLTAFDREGDPVQVQLPRGVMLSLHLAPLWTTIPEPPVEPNVGDPARPELALVR